MTRTCSDYATAEAVLALGGTAASRRARKIANNTYLERRDDQSIAVRLHSTDVVTYHADGSITLNSGGWQTVTTKDRMNAYSPFRVASVKGAWTVRPKDDRTSVIRYFDGVRIAADGTIVNAPAEDLDVIAERDDETHKLIGKYLRGLTSGVISELIAAANASGVSGDCWDCSLYTKEGVPLGDASGKTDHLRFHLEERYYMLSLILNALAERGYRYPELILNHHETMLSSIKRALRMYLTKRLMENRQGRMPVGA